MSRVQGLGLWIPAPAQVHGDQKCVLSLLLTARIVTWMRDNAVIACMHHDAALAHIGMML